MTTEEREKLRTIAKKLFGLQDNQKVDTMDELEITAEDMVDHLAYEYLIPVDVTIWLQDFLDVVQEDFTRQRD